MNELIERQFDYRPRVAVFGDAMLDEYYNVTADRVSPEFPIPVMKMHQDRPKIVLGGAANVCRQFSNFNFDVSLFALTNENINHLAGNIDMDGCVFSKGVPLKKRFYSDGFPLCRLDVEGDNYNLSSGELESLRSKILEKFFSADPFSVVVFSDYDKGLFNGIGQFIHKIDPHPPFCQA